MINQDISNELQHQVKTASDATQPLRLHGGDSKAFYGGSVDGKPLDLSEHSGIISYEPTELVLTARCGTPLCQIETLLSEHKQRLAFDPPCFTRKATLGGAIASGLAGPVRPWGGAPRDSVLGIKLLDGQGQILSFGGQVMKNVAGYDVTRLMAGAFGTLGVLLEISVKILPQTDAEATLVLTMDRTNGLNKMRELALKPAPLSGVCYWQGRLYLRFNGNHASVTDWQQQIGGDRLEDSAAFWRQLRDHQLDFFASDQTLWRLSLPPATPKLSCEQDVLLDWAGAQRWVYSDQSAQSIRDQVAEYQGHAEAFRHVPAGVPVFHPMNQRLVELHQKLQQTFDPQGVFNPGRLTNH